MAHHAVHLIAAVAIIAGSSVAMWALERRPVQRGGTADSGSRGEWEGRLFGMGTAVRTEAVPAIRPYEGGSRWPEAARVAAALSLFAGAIHLAALPEHLGESVWFGAFFLCSGAFQIASGIRMRTRPTPGLATTVALANAAVVGLWVLSRTEGVPVGPAPWVPEGIGLLDAVATVCEIGLVAVAVFMSRKRDAGTAKGSWRWPGVSLPR